MALFIIGVGIIFLGGFSCMIVDFKRIDAFSNYLLAELDLQYQIAKENIGKEGYNIVNYYNLDVFDSWRAFDKSNFWNWNFSEMLVYDR